MAWSASSLAAVLLLASATHDRQRFEAAEPHMGTIFRIVLYAEDAGRAREGFAGAFERVRQLDAIFSDYDESSEAMRVCREACARPAKVSPDLFRVLQASQRLSEETEGAFDVTIGTLTRLWRAARRERRLPSAKEIETARLKSGFGNLVLDPAQQTVQIRQCGLLLDFGAIAKGYAADEALSELRKRGITQALVAASGDLAIGAAPPGLKGWSIGVESFDESERQALELSNVAISTSGDSEQYLEIGGKRYSHILDARTGTPLTESIAVTVIAQEGMVADSFATAISALGPTAGMAFLERHPSTAGAIVTQEGTKRSQRFPPLLRR